MPKIIAELDDEPLFSDEDPLELTIPEVGTWRLSNYEVNPPDDGETNPETRPITYLVQLLAAMAWESDADLEAGRTPNADKMAEKVTDALTNGDLKVSELGKIMEQIGKATRAAIKARAARSSGRPTRGRRH